MKTAVAVALATVCGAHRPLSAQPAQGANTVLREPPIPLLQSHLPGLDRNGDALTGQDPAAVDAANAAVLKEDGLTRFATATYTRQAGKAPIAATAMQFVDATGAFSAFTFYRSQLPRARELTGAAKLGTQSVADGDTTLAWAGTVVLKTKGAATGKELLPLVSSLPKVGGRAGMRPLLPTYVPESVPEIGLVATSVRYALGPIAYQAMGGVLPVDTLGFGKSGEAITADYTSRSGKGELTLLLYPTPQIAGDAGRAIEKALNAPGIGAHGSLGTVKMRRVGPLLGVTTGGFSLEQAEALIAGLHLNQEVTFEKPMPPEFHAEVRKTASLLENILIFTGVMALAAVLLAVFLGGARAGWRVMHGKSAASEPEFLTIDLRGRPHAIVTEPASVEASGRPLDANPS